MHADLLSGTKTGTDPATRKRPGRLVSDHAEPTGTRLPERLVQIHARESAQGPAKEFSYIIQELLHESSDEPNKSAYVDQIINTIISTGRANDFIIAMCNLSNA